MPKKRKKGRKDAYEEVLEGPGLFMAHKDRHILMQGTASPEEHKAFLEAIRDNQGEAEASIQNRIEEIDNLIRGYDPLDIIAQMSLRNSNFDAENFKEYEAKINPAYTEYITLLCLTQSYESFHFQNPKPITADFIEELQGKVKDLFQAETLNLVFKDIDPDNPGRTTMDRLRLHSLSESLYVRYSAYDHHLIETLLGIFSPLTADMEDSLGFNISHVMTILAGVEEVRFLKLSQRWAEATDFEQKLRKAARDYRKHKRHKNFSSEFPDDLLEKSRRKNQLQKEKFRRSSQVGHSTLLEILSLLPSVNWLD